MRRLWILLIAVAALAATASVAGAQGRIVERSNQNLRLQGSVEVEFGGTAEAGCARFGVCDLTGTVSYVPGGQGQLFINTFRRANGSLRRQVDAFSFGFGPSAPQTVGVTRRGDQQCVDARSVDGGSYDVAFVDGDLRIGLAPASASRFAFFGGGGGGDLLRTRCAGPRAAEVLSVLGTKRVSLESLSGGRRLSFRANEPFSAGGFAGTVRSSVRLVLNPARRQQIRRRAPRRPRTVRPRRARTTRQVRVPLRLVRIAGDASIDLAGDPNTCRRLDACGLTGTTTVTPRPPARRAFFSLSVRSRSRAAALAAVGLGTARSARIASGGGGVGWSTDNGRASTTQQRDGVRELLHGI